MKINKLCMILLCICFQVSILLTIVDIQSFSKSFYQKEYTKDQTAQSIGMSDEDLMKSTSALLDYLKDDRQDIVEVVTVNGVEREVFDERETAHMVDVKALYQNAMLVRNIFLFLSIVGMLILYFRDKNSFKKNLEDAYKQGFLTILIFVCMLGIFAIVDFNTFWTMFHQIFFSNDLWLLDPRVSIMINMFPESFFFHLVLRIIGFYLASIILVYLLIHFLLKGETHDSYRTL